MIAVIWEMRCSSLLISLNSPGPSQSTRKAGPPVSLPFWTVPLVPKSHLNSGRIIEAKPVQI
jgi:hypothetical protein